MDEDVDEDHHSDDSCLLHEFKSPTCTRAVSPRRSTSRPCCSTSFVPCHPVLTSSRPRLGSSNSDELNSRIDNLRRHSTGSSHDNRRDFTTCGGSCRLTWNVSLLRALRKDPTSVPERRRSDGTTRIRQPGRADVCFTPRKGDLIIHHEKKPERKVLEFYNPICQRLHDGDILVRFKIDSYACEGLVLVKGSAYLYHRGFWVYLGKDSDQIVRSCSW